MPRTIAWAARALATVLLLVALALPAAALADGGKGRGNGNAGATSQGQAAAAQSQHGSAGDHQGHLVASSSTATATPLPGGTEGLSPSNPDARGAGTTGQGVDKPYAAAGQKAESQQYGGTTAYFDGNNGCGQDKHSGEARETDTVHTGWDDNNGWCGRKPAPTTAAGAGARGAVHGVEVAGVQVKSEHEEVPAPEIRRPAEHAPAPESQPPEQAVMTTTTAPGGIGPAPEVVSVAVPQMSAPAAAPAVVVQGVQVPGAALGAELAPQAVAPEQAAAPGALEEAPPAAAAAETAETAGEVAGVQAPGTTVAKGVAGVQAAPPAAVAPSAAPAAPAAVAGAQSPFVNLMPSTGQPLLDYGLLGAIPTALAGAGLAIARLAARQRR